MYCQPHLTKAFQHYYQIILRHQTPLDFVHVLEGISILHPLAYTIAKKQPLNPNDIFAFVQEQRARLHLPLLTSTEIQSFTPIVIEWFRPWVFRVHGFYRQLCDIFKETPTQKMANDLEQYLNRLITILCPLEQWKNEQRLLQINSPMVDSLAEQLAAL